MHEHKNICAHKYFEIYTHLAYFVKDATYFGNDTLKHAQIVN